MPDFLLEIGLEEVPARMIAGAQAELLRRTLALLGKEALLPEGFDPLTDALSYSTPRRLAVLVHGVRQQQDDISEETTGPAVKIAFKDGQPIAAAEAFARKSGVAVSDLRTISTAKGEYLAATSVKKGRSAAQVIASELPKEIAAIYWAKNMYWRPGKPERFVRPVLWIACLLGDEIVPLQFAGKTAGRASYGHRVLSNGEPFEIVSPESYLAQLEGEYVLADVEARRHKIRKALDRVTRTVPGVRWREDEALVDTVTHLTEWPDVLLGSFDPAFLELPEEVLVTVMRDHQKYFAVETPHASGAPRLDSETWETKPRLAPHFLTVTNVALDADNEPIIRQGNERVLRARFNDARFFWDFDQRTPLADRVKLLENVTFQKDLGSYAAKSERVATLAAKLGFVVEQTGTLVRGDDLYLVCQLAKTDLTTELVKEFPELQGIIGGLYAASQGVAGHAAEAIYDQYVPAGMDDRVPRSVEGALLGIADRADTIAGMFGLGMEPTGSKDPFALRRAANGIVKILAETGISLTLDPIVDYSAKDDPTVTKMLNFFRERIEFYLREVNGTPYDVIAAVLSAGFFDVRDVIARAAAVTEARAGEDFAAVSAAFKRMKNILTQANFSLPEHTTRTATGEPVETALHAKFTSIDEKVRALSAARMYTEALAAIATLRPEVDAFFEGVMVNDPDPAVRQRRLTQLSLIVDSFSGIADFSEIVTAG
jgi:glycyl-tRNA synthetase beta chain